MLPNGFSTIKVKSITARREIKFESSKDEAREWEGETNADEWKVIATHKTEPRI